MEHFQTVELSVAKRPVLWDQHSELECLLQDKVAIYDRSPFVHDLHSLFFFVSNQPSSHRNEKTKYEDGILRLTTHRLIWQGPKGEALGVPLELVSTVELQASQPSPPSSPFSHLTPFLFLCSVWWPHDDLIAQDSHLLYGGRCLHPVFFSEWGAPGLLCQAPAHPHGRCLEGTDAYHQFVEGFVLSWSLFFDRKSRRNRPRPKNKNLTPHGQASVRPSPPSGHLVG